MSDQPPVLEYRTDRRWPGWRWAGLGLVLAVPLLAVHAYQLRQPNFRSPPYIIRQELISLKDGSRAYVWYPTQNPKARDILYQTFAQLDKNDLSDDGKTFNKVFAKDVGGPIRVSNIMPLYYPKSELPPEAEERIRYVKRSLLP